MCSATGHLWGFKPCRQIPRFCSQNRKRLDSPSSTLLWTLLPEFTAFSFWVCVWSVHLCMKSVCMQINTERCMHTRTWETDDNLWCQPQWYTPPPRKQGLTTDLALTNEATLDRSSLPALPRPAQPWCYTRANVSSIFTWLLGLERGSCWKREENIYFFTWSWYLWEFYQMNHLPAHFYSLPRPILHPSYYSQVSLRVSVKWGHPYSCALVHANTEQ